jgi:predicted HAD superfamily Cof-like phosphohydrolase
METPDSIGLVAEFHRTFKHPVQAQPLIPGKERCDLRISLLAEELEELKAAVDSKNIVEVADALCDLQYVLAGAILEFGLGDKFRQLFGEVHRSNMSKACKSMSEAESTLEYYRNSSNTEAYIKESDGSFLVYRTSDNKTLKSLAYSPARLLPILEAGE